MQFFLLVAATAVLFPGINGQGEPAQPPLCNSTMPCPTGSSCLLLSGCVLGTCLCKPGWRMDTTSTSYACVMASKTVGMTCTKDAECSGEMTACVSSSSTPPSMQCKCTGSYVPNSANTDCIPQPLGTACTLPSAPGSFCGTNAECGSTSGVCQCSANYKRLDNYGCTPLVQGDACNATRDCVSPSDCAYALCSNNTYQCSSGYKWFSGFLGGMGTCVLNNATLPGLSQGQTCDMQGPYSRVCASSLACSLCPENIAALLFTCVGAPVSSPATVATTVATVTVTSAGATSSTTKSSTTLPSTTKNGSASPTLASFSLLLLILRLIWSVTCY